MRISFLLSLLITVSAQAQTKSESAKRDAKTKEEALISGAIGNEILLRALKSSTPSKRIDQIKIPTLTISSDGQIVTSLHYVTIAPGLTQGTPNSASTCFDVAEEYARRGLYAKAVKMYKKTIEFEPHYAFAHYKLAKVYIAMKDFESASREYQKLSSLNEDLANVLFFEIHQ